MNETINLVYLEDNNLRLDLFLVKYLNKTRSLIEKIIKEGCVKVNDVLIPKPGFILKKNYHLVIDLFNFQKPQEELKDLQITFNVIYEDEYLMVIYKPKGLICHQSVFKEQDTLVNQIKTYYAQRHVQFDDLVDLRCGLLHRLDKDTAGLLLVAKKRDVFNQLKKDLEDKKIKRYYYALVKHPFPSNLVDFKIDLALNHDYKSTKMIVDQNGKSAITLVKVLQNFKNNALVECELLTGRTHQIRAHLSAIAHPVYNDPIYGTKRNDLGQYLFAHRLVFYHYQYNKIMDFESGFDPLLQTKLKELEKC